MFYRLLIPVVGLFQLWLCFRRTRLFNRLIPLLTGGILEFGSWLLVFVIFLVNPNPSVDVAAMIFLGILLGIQILVAAGAAWLVYGLVKLVQKLKKKFVV